MKTVIMILTMWCASLSCLVAQNTISAGRAIRIEIKGVPVDEAARVTGSYTVSDGGTIRMPLLSSPVRAAGLSPTALAQSIEAAYRAERIYTMPTINITASSLEDLEEIVVTVGGQVNRTGQVKFHKGLTLWEALQAAGGSTPFGATNRVVLLRGSQSKEYNMKNPQHMNIQLEARDNINVPQKNAWGQ